MDPCRGLIYKFTPMGLLIRPVVLASASPYRAQIMRDAGIDFTVQPANIDEELHPPDKPRPYVRSLATRKAMAVVTAVPRESIVIAADTIGFMRKLDVKEIHGYDASRGLKLIGSAALGERSAGKKRDTESGRSITLKTNGPKGKPARRPEKRGGTVSIQPARTAAPSGRVRARKR